MPHPSLKSKHTIMLPAEQPKKTEKTILKSHPPILDRRSVLLDHVAAILDSASQGKCCVSGERVCTEELQTLTDGELMDLLRQRDKLEKFAEGFKTQRMIAGTESPSSTEEEQPVGNLLFDRVSKIETELCAQITGMLLELDPALIDKLLSDSTALKNAVTKAKEEYLKVKHPGVLLGKEDIGDTLLESGDTLLESGDTLSESGDALYKQVFNICPQNAAQITGMLLELPHSCIRSLLHDQNELTGRLEEAKQSLQSVGKWRTEEAA